MILFCGTYFQPCRQNLSYALSKAGLMELQTISTRSVHAVPIGLFPVCQRTSSPYDSIGCLTLSPNDKILDWSKFKALADDKINETQKLKNAFGWVENILGKEEMLVTSTFSFFQNVFKSLVLQRLIKLGTVW